MNDIVLIYSYLERPTSKFNLEFFLTKLRSNIDYIFVINNFNCSITIPKLPNIEVIRKENKGQDFGAYRTGIDYVASRDYKYYFFMNCGAFGPVLPSYDQDMDWTKVFTSKINDKVKVVSTSIQYTCWWVKPPRDIRNNQPSIQGYFFTMDNQALKTLLSDSIVFDYTREDYDAVFDGEFGIGSCMFRNGYSIDCLLRKYRHIDWSDNRQWVNPGIDPTRPKQYYGQDINPYEVIFYKWIWVNNNQLQNIKIIYDYVNEHK
jgi:hypothetical protein